MYRPLLCTLEDRRAQSALVLPAKLERRVGALAARHPLAALERS